MTTHPSCLRWRVALKQIEFQVVLFQRSTSPSTPAVPSAMKSRQQMWLTDRQTDCRPDVDTTAYTSLFSLRITASHFSSLVTYYLWLLLCAYLSLIVFLLLFFCVESIKMFSFFRNLCLGGQHCWPHVFWQLGCISNIMDYCCFEPNKFLLLLLLLLVLLLLTRSARYRCR